LIAPNSWQPLGRPSLVVSSSDEGHLEGALSPLSFHRDLARLKKGGPTCLIDRIEQALDRGVDPDVFERAASALLQCRYPWLSPVEAGRDLGRDRALIEEKRERIRGR
jgi:hypothetical protein